MEEIELLSAVLTKTGNVIEGVQPSQRDLATPCPDYDVGGLTNHIVGWLGVFEAGCHGRSDLSGCWAARVPAPWSST